MRKSYLFLAIAIVIIVCLSAYVFSLRSQIQHQVDQTGVKKVNEQFLKRFFTYNSMKQRYANIKPMMTEEGYKATFPSGLELPDTESSVVSKMSDLEPFSDVSEDKAEFLNEFKVSTTFNKVTNTQGIIVKTELIKDKKGSWLVNDVQFVGNLGEQKPAS